MPSDINAGKTTIEIGASDKGFQAALKRTQTALFGFATLVQSKIGGLSDSMKTGFQAVLDASLKATSLMDKSSEKFASLQDIILSIKGALGATEAEYERLYNIADKMSRTRRIGAEQAATGMLSLARGGFSVDEIERAIEPVLNLSKATGTTLDRAVETAMDTMRAFGFQASDMGMISDTLTAGANFASQSIEQLTDALRYSASSAALAGTSFKDLVTMIATLANFGVKGSMAGTAIRQIYTSLANERIGKKLKGEFGVLTEIGGELRQPLDVLKDLDKALANVGSAKRLQVFQEIFGQRGKLGGMNLRPGEFARLSQKMQGTGGYAKSTAMIMESGTGAAMEKIANAQKSIVRIFGEAQNEIWVRWEKTYSKVADTINNFLKQNKKLIADFSNFLAVATPVAGALIGVAVSIKILSFAMAGLVGVFGIVPAVIGAAVGAITFMISPLGLLATGLGIVTVSVMKFFTNTGDILRWFDTQIKDIAPSVEKTMAAIGVAMESRDLPTILGTAWAGIKLIFASVLNSLQSALINFKAWIGTVWTEIWAPLGEILDYFLADIQLSIQTWLKWIMNSFTYAQAVWNEMRTTLTKGFLSIPGMKTVVGVSDEDVKAWEKSQSKSTSKILEQIEKNDAEYAEKKKEILSKLGSYEDKLAAENLAREREKNAALLRLNEDYAEKKKALDEELAKQQAKAEKKIKENKAKEITENPLTVDEIMRGIPQLLEKVKRGSDQGAAIAAETSAQGRFLGWGLRGMEAMAGGRKIASEELQTKQLQAIEKTNKLLEENAMCFE